MPGERRSLKNLPAAERKALVARALAARAGKTKTAAIPPRGPGAPPLSAAQERLWFMEQLEAGQAAYHLACAWRLRGDLRVDALQRALDAIVARHEAWRTSFPVRDGRPVMDVAPDGRLPLAREDLRAAPGTLPARVRALQRAPYDLARGPLVRAHLLRVGEQEWAFVLCAHHLVFDGWSSEVFRKELASHYAAFARGGEAALPPLPVQYPDFAAWQRDWIERGGVDGQLEYWRDQLAPPRPVLETPTDRPRPPARSYEGARRRFTLDAGLVAGLRRLVRGEQASLFMALLGLHGTLLHRYSGQEDLTIGFPVANRNRPEIEPLLGCFINTLVLRSDASGDPTFRDYLRRTRATCLDAYANQDVPFATLVGALKPERDLGRNPLFDEAFVHLAGPDAGPDLAGLEVVPLDVDAGVAMFDCTLYMAESGDTVAGTFEYATALYDEATIDRRIAHFRELARGVVADPDRPLSRLPLLAAPERATIVEAWNDTAAEYPRDAALHELFEAQAARTPDAVAAASGAETVTYDALNRRANRLAHRLRELGVAPGTCVGICVDRSVAMLAGVLGILKAGGAYVPLDPDYPLDRLRHMLEDSAAPVVVTVSGVRDALPDHDAALVVLDGLAGGDESNPARAAGPDDLAYLIYTSGSTGQPKGVQVPHGAVVNFLTSMARRPGFSADDTLLAVTTLSFDIAVLELYLPLLVGARTVIATREDAADGMRLRALLAESGATVLQSTPATWRLLLAAGWEGDPRLKALCGGEALPRDLARELAPRVGELWNMYGPTETTVWSTCRRIDDPEAPIRIGRPIANTQVYVVDRHLQPVPAGVVGELLIGGAGVTRGYRDRPELTADRFVANPFGPGRVYRTGDAASFDADGELTCHHRLDHQVKVRGYRIELGEVEAVLAAHPAVEAAVAVVREDRPGDARLAAYYVAESPFEAEALRRHLRGSLPDYMIPSHLVALEALPQTPNGKVDRKALPAPEAEAPAGGTRVAPRNETEEAVAAVWRDVLGVADVGVHETFTEMGGHSLLATRVVARLRGVFPVEIGVRDFFERPTVARLAAWIAARNGDDREEMEF